MTDRLALEFTSEVLEEVPVFTDDDLEDRKDDSVRLADDEEFEDFEEELEDVPDERETDEEDSVPRLL